MGKGAGRPRAYYWLDSGPSRDKGGMWIGEDSSFTTARGQGNKCKHSQNGIKLIVLPDDMRRALREFFERE